MKKLLKLLLAFIIIPFTSCNEPICEEQLPSADLAIVNSEIFTVHYLSFQQSVDINNINHGEMFIALENENFYYVEFDVDYKEYGIDMLHSGEKIKISYTGEIKEVERKFTIENGAIQDIEVIEKANRYYFELYNVPGADPYDFDIVYKGEDTSSKFKFDTNIFFINNNLDYVSLPYGYNGLKLYGVDNPNPYTLIEDDFIHIYSLHVEDEYTKPNRDEYEQEQARIESLNNYIKNIYLAVNYMHTPDYGYVIESDNYRKTFQHINNVRRHKTEYFTQNSYDITGIYEIVKGTTKFYHINGVCYESNDNYGLKINYDFEQIIIRIYNEYLTTTFKANEIYNGYKLIVNQIDPCCNGPIESIRFENQKDENISFEIRVVENQNEIQELITIDEEKYIPYEEYYNNMVLQASKINLSLPYKLLDKFDDRGNDNLIFDYGFGGYRFIEKKYESFECENKVVFHVSSYPDFSYSLGSHIVSIEITDNEVSFDGFTLNSSKEEIINYYTTQGYVLIDESKLYLNGLLININEVNGLVTSIIYSCYPTNVENLEF